MKNCKSQIRCKVDNCNKRHHTLLQEDNPPKTDIQNNNFSKHFDTNKTFMQIIPVTISNKNRSIRTNALLDNGSDATRLTQDIVEQLDLKGKSRRLSINNAVLKKSEVESKLVNFDLSSDSHPNKLKLENAWVVSSLDVNHKNFDITNLKEKFKHLQGIPIPSLNPGGVSLFKFTSTRGSM